MHEVPSETSGLRLWVAYDGTDFCGFQLQPQQRSVQGVLEQAAEVLAGHPVRVRAAGRTDAGVHALGQIVAFDSARWIAERGWKLGLNQHLPDDVRVQRVEACAVGYNPRFDSSGKHYRYLIQGGEAKNPLLRRRVWQLGTPRELHLDRMREAAQRLVGTHDYRAFRASDDVRANSTRTLWSIEIQEAFGGDPSLVAIDVQGTAFMKHMVRILSGTLVDIGLGRLPLARTEELLGPDAQRIRAGQTAPAHGLTLVEVRLGRRAREVPEDADSP